MLARTKDTCPCSTLVLQRAFEKQPGEALQQIKTMDRSEPADDWPSDDSSESRDCGLSTSDSENPEPASLVPRSRLRPAGAALTFVPFANWDPERSYDGEPTIRYNVEWKLFVKNRGQAGESELDIVISPHKFWKHVLRPKVTEASANKPWVEETTKLVLSLPKEDEVSAYSVWQRSRVRDEERKKQYRLAEELTLKHCYDLDMLASNQERMYRFYVRQGIAEGIAWRY
ncbi:hypothetical protein S40293_09988, partial [Stachybotrys chartarum IBT 40293]